jgi:hypothetical protein
VARCICTPPKGYPGPLFQNVRVDSGSLKYDP